MERNELLHRLFSGMFFFIAVVAIVLQNGALGAIASAGLLIPLGFVWFARQICETIREQLGGYRLIDKLSNFERFRYSCWLWLIVSVVGAWILSDGK